MIVILNCINELVFVKISNVVMCVLEEIFPHWIKLMLGGIWTNIRLFECCWLPYVWLGQFCHAMNFCLNVIVDGYDGIASC